MLTGTQLFANIDPVGSYTCYYCGGICGTKHSVSEFVKPTFTNRDIILSPASDYVCSGCVCSLNERATITLGTGEIRENQKTRLYTWVFTASGRTAYTKSHINMLRDIVLNPPSPPFGIVLAVSGQKQLLFRSRVAWDREVYPLLLEDEIVIVNTKILKDLLRFITPLVAAIGKVAISEMDLNSAIRFYEYFGGVNFEIFDQWKLIKDQPLSRLAIFLSPNQKEAQNEYPKLVSVKPRAVPDQVGLFD